MLKLITNDPQVISVDIDLRRDSLVEFEQHPFRKYVSLVAGSSIALDTFEVVKSLLRDTSRVMVVLDSDHTHDHVLQELKLYSSIVSTNCYLVVLDTGIEDMPDEFFNNRPWGKGNNPKTAVHAFLKENTKFIIDRKINDEIVISSAPDGFLLKVRD
jgi:cephalosporin hydroxylase